MVRNFDAGITVEYGEKYLPSKRHKKPRVRHMVVGEKIHFKKMDLSDFPIAFIVHDYHTVYEGKTEKEFEKNRQTDKGDYRMVDVEIRTYGGKLYKARRFSYGAAIGTGFPDIFEAVDGIRHYGHTMSRWEDGDFYEKSDERYDEKKIVVLENNRADRVSRLQKKADEYIFCDNKIWEECGEPMYVVCTFGLGHNHGGTGMFIEDFYNENISGDNYFNALQRKEAIDYANKVASGRGDTNDVGTFGKMEDITVLMPEMVKRNPKTDHANGGDPFLQTLEGIISGSETVGEAGIGVICATLASL